MMKMTKTQKLVTSVLRNKPLRECVDVERCSNGERKRENKSVIKTAQRSATAHLRGLFLKTDVTSYQLMGLGLTLPVASSGARVCYVNSYQLRG